ncbi:MAG: hypothetical protein M3Q48_02660 [Actinomycetota bacterium]|nr:hypothetical protein [Actinomycetota bacterium]
MHRLSRRGSRQLNHAIHIAAITPIRHTHSEGRASYDRKVAEGKTNEEIDRPALPSSAGAVAPRTYQRSSSVDL